MNSPILQDEVRAFLESVAESQEIDKANALYGLNLEGGITRRELLDAVARHVEQGEEL